jgi:hypothetical protein
LSKHQKPKRAPNLFSLGHQKEFQVNTELSVRIGLGNTNIIFCAKKLHKGSKSETKTIPQKHIDFANDNLARIAAAENDVDNGYEAEDGDGKT